MTTRPQLKRKMPSIPNTGLQLYYSDFAITDQKNFAEFYIGSISDEIEAKPFKFLEKDILFELDYEVQWQDNGHSVELDNKFFLDKQFIMYFSKKYKEIKIFKLKSWLGESTERKFGVITADGGKLIGVLLAQKK